MIEKLRSDQNKFKEEVRNALTRHRTPSLRAHEEEEYQGEDVEQGGFRPATTRREEVMRR